ncbi:hypothetical protein VTH82DRAFT_5314 [Thermothelomyces myriococcoides]
MGDGQQIGRSRTYPSRYSRERRAYHGLNEEDPAVLIAKTNAKSDHAQATFEEAKNRLKTTQEHLQATQELYQKSSKLLLEQQNKLAETGANSPS